MDAQTAAGGGAGGVVAVLASLASYRYRRQEAWDCTPCASWLDTGPTSQGLSPAWTALLVGVAFAFGLAAGPTLDILVVLRGGWRRLLSGLQRRVEPDPVTSSVQIDEIVDRAIENRLSGGRARAAHLYRPGQIGYSPLT